MTLNEYQEKAAGTAVYPPEHQLLYTALGIAGEAGEYVAGIMAATYMPVISTNLKASDFMDGVRPDVEDDPAWVKAHEVAQLLSQFVISASRLEALKKEIRSKKREPHLTVRMTPEDATQAMLELGDQLWYISDAAKRLGYTLEDVAAANLDKLARRREADQLKERQ